MKYQISQTAYVKLALHALKHRSAAVNGILVGRVSGGGGGGGAEEDSAATVSIVDCVPLFHGQLGLLPMLELALTQIEEYFSSHQEGLSIVGCYHANERFDDYDLSGIPRKIGDHIARYFSSACVLLLDNRLLESLAKAGKKPAFSQLFTRDSSRGWRSAPGSSDLVLAESTANEILYDYILEGREQSVTDFDDHLDDISKDWLNPGLFD
ncbi:hypothetical protein SELMODRAFT_73953 [Selaginella moellendorffii]|uniref:MPN domain-containing protein n=1 Tax=Selaginella moellendorffii TaxID=88036 RepID=D8QNN0_SELML|nr:hypothetical protein SELMODRAFT_73953 [Selaginella moellendorffii]